jgi:DNA-binding MarR family transcriptional regulator
MHPPRRDNPPSSLLDDAGPRNETLRFMQWLWAVDHGLQSLSKRMRTTVGVTGPQRLVVRMLGQSPGLSAGELATVLHLHQSTLTGVLRRLERLGIVSRSSSPADRRRAVLRLTAAGRVLDRERTGTVESAVRAALEGVSPAAVVTTAEVLAKVAAELRRTATDGRRLARKTRRR